MQEIYFYLFTIFLILFSLKERKKEVWFVSIYAFGVYFIQYQFKFDLSIDGITISIISFIALLFAYFIKHSKFNLAYFICLFLIGVRTMGFPPDGDFGEKDLGIVFISGMMGFSILWGFLLIYHSKKYQKFLLMFLYFFMFYHFFLAFLSLQATHSAEIKERELTLLENLFLFVLTLLGLYQVYCTSKEKVFLFAFLALFIFLAILYLQNDFASIWFVALFAVGFILQPISYIIFYFGEPLLLILLIILQKQEAFLSEDSPNA